MGPILGITSLFVSLGAGYKYLKYQENEENKDLLKSFREEDAKIPIHIDIVKELHSEISKWERLLGCRIKLSDWGVYYESYHDNLDRMCRLPNEWVVVLDESNDEIKVWSIWWEFLDEENMSSFVEETIARQLPAIFARRKQNLDQKLIQEQR